MAVKTIQLGQVWRKDENGQDYLVTKVYDEVFAQYAGARQGHEKRCRRRSPGFHVHARRIVLESALSI